MHHKYHVPEVIHLVIAVAAVIENYRIYREVKLVISLIKNGWLIFILRAGLTCYASNYGMEKRGKLEVVEMIVFHLLLFNEILFWHWLWHEGPHQHLEHKVEDDLSNQEGSPVVIIYASIILILDRSFEV